MSSQVLEILIRAREDASDQFARIAASFGEVKSQADKLAASFHDVEDSGKRLETIRLAAAFDDIDEKALAVKKSAGELAAAFGDVEQETRKSTFDLAAFGQTLGSVGGQLRNVGATLTASLTAPIVGAGVAVTKAAIDYETAFAGVRKTVEGSAAQLKVLEQGFRDLSKTIPVSAVELAKIGEAAGQLGIQTESVLGFTAVMAKLGVTTDLTADQAATALGKLANTMKMPQDQFDRLASSVVALGNAGASTESEIVNMAQRIAGAGNQLGLAEHQVLAIAAALSDVGIEAEAGGSAISKVLINMSLAVSKGGEDLQAFAKIAGISMEEFAQKFRDDAPAALDLFIQGLAKMKAEGKDVIGVVDAMGISEIRERNAVLSLAGTQDGLTNALKRSKQAWEENTALSKEAAERFKTTESQLVLLGNRIRDVGISLGNTLQPAIRAAVDALTDMMPLVESAVRAFAELPTGTKLAAGGFIAVTAAIGPLVFITGTLAGSISNLIGLWKTLAATSLGTWVATQIAALGGLGAALTTASMAIASFAIGFAAAAAAFGVGFVVGTWMVNLIARFEAGRKAIKDFDDAMARLMAGNKEKAVVEGGQSAMGGWTQEQFQAYLAFLKQAADARKKLSEKEKEGAAASGGAASATTRLVSMTDAQIRAALTAASNTDILKKANEALGIKADDTKNKITDLATAKRVLAAAASMSGKAIEEETKRLVAQAASISNAKVTWTGFFMQMPAAIKPAETAMFDFREATSDATVTGLDLIKKLAGALPELDMVIDKSKGYWTRYRDVVDQELENADGDIEDHEEAVEDFQKTFEQVMSVVQAAMQAYQSSAKEGALAGAQFGAQFGIVGAAVGATVGGLLGWIGSAGRAREEARRLAAEARALALEISKMRTEFIASQGGIEILELAAKEAGVSLQAMWDAKTVEAYNAAVDEVTAAIALHESAIDKTKEAMERWGLTIEQMGPAFQSQMLHEGLAEIWQDFALLQAAGADLVALLNGEMGAAIQNLVTQSISMGVALPESVRPMIQKMIDLGLLFDENGNKITDISQLTFTETLEAGVARLITEIRELVRALQGIPKEINTNINVNTHHNNHPPQDQDPPTDPPVGGGHSFGGTVPWTPGAGRWVKVGETKTEHIMSDEQLLGMMARAGVMAGGGAAAGTGGGGDIYVPVTLQIDAERVAQAMYRRDRAGHVMRIS